MAIRLQLHGVMEIPGCALSKDAPGEAVPVTFSMESLHPGHFLGQQELAEISDWGIMLSDERCEDLPSAEGPHGTERGC